MAVDLAKLNAASSVLLSQRVEIHLATRVWMCYLPEVGITRRGDSPIEAVYNAYMASKGLYERVKK